MLSLVRGILIYHLVKGSISSQKKRKEKKKKTQSLKSFNLTKANDAPQIDRSQYFTLRDSKTLSN
jgi:hypothetical protein